MSKMKKNVSGSDCLEIWDVPYFSMQGRQSFDRQCYQISEYFSLGACMEGLNRLFNKLYNVQLCLVDPLPGELWHNDVYKLSVQEIDTAEELGIIYCDFFYRSGK